MGKGLTLHRPSAVVPRVSVSPPTVYSGGPIESIFARMQARRDAATMRALAVRAEAAAVLRNNEAAVVDSDARLKEALARHADLPNKIAHQLEIARLEREEEMRAFHHMMETKA